MEMLDRMQSGRFKVFSTLSPWFEEFRLFRRFYWDAVLGAELPDGVDHAMFDFAVNSGPGRAAKYLQAVVGVSQDGRVGPATIAATKAKPAGVVVDVLCDNRLAFLKRLPTWATFGKGWQSRVASVRSAALMMTAQPQAAPPAPVQPIPAPQSSAPAPVSPAPQPQLRTDEPKPAGVGKSAAAAGLFVLAAAAVANWWHELSAWVHSFF
ncbi:hypothetical protein BPNPMPFG_001886 [Mesorhizobium sp. AR07]|nr:hypothetical protein BPNPMPFG_001886 [Mesorhizobium sp. AR07]